MKVAVIASRELALGFGLAGIKDRRVVSCREEAEEALKIFTNNSAIGLILLDRETAGWIEPQIAVIHGKKQPYPQILTVPGWGEIMQSEWRRE